MRALGLGAGNQQLLSASLLSRSLCLVFRDGKTRGELTSLSACFGASWASSLCGAGVSKLGLLAVYSGAALSCNVCLPVRGKMAIASEGAKNAITDSIGNTSEFASLRSHFFCSLPKPREPGQDHGPAQEA